MSIASHSFASDSHAAAGGNPALALPASISERSLLMQDAIPAGALAQGSGINQIALFSNPALAGQSEALVINTESTLTYLQRTATSSTGWRQTTVPGVPKVKEVVIAVHCRAEEIWAACVKDDGIEPGRQARQEDEHRRAEMRRQPREIEVGRRAGTLIGSVTFRCR